MKKGDLYHVEAPHFVAGFLSVDGTIYHAAPILHWLVHQHKTVDWFGQYCDRKGWILTKLKEKES